VSQHAELPARSPRSQTSAGRAARWAATGLLLWLSSIGCAVPQPRGEGKLERIVEPTVRRGYWLYLPKDYVHMSEAERTTRRWPLVVSFHGMKPFDNARPQALEWESEADRYGYIVVAPELKAPDVLAEFPLRTVHPALKSDDQATLAVLDHVFSTTQADRGNVLATSWSSGGYMAHYMVNRHPDLFTCAAVRQSNFSSSVLDESATSRSIHHPILIINTQNDFAICRKESAEAVKWYERHGYRNVAWVVLKNYGHERTPDTAASFFALVAGIEPKIPPAVLIKRQAVDGNAHGLAFLSGKLAAPRRAEPPPQPTDIALRPSPQQTPARARPTGGPPAFAAAPPPRPAPEDLGPTTPKRVAAIPARPSLPQRSPLNIRVSSPIGIEPLALGFSAECPPDWQERADFLWTLDGEPIANGVNGHKTLAKPGEYTLGLLVVTAQGQEHRAARSIRVLPRLDSTSLAAGKPDK